MALKTHIKPATQLVLILLVLKSSVTITVTWTSVICTICLAMSLLSYWRSKLRKFGWLSFNRQKALDFSDNPFKGKVGPGYLSKQREAEIASAVADSVLYNADTVSSVHNFQPLKRKTECIFAKRSKVWGSPDYDKTLSLEENTRRLIPTFYKFTMAFQDLALDAFLIELPGELYGENIQIFGDAVRRVLMTMREADVSRQRQKLLKNAQTLDENTIQNHLRYLVEDPKAWNRRSWVFQFNRITFFITTFAPFYPETNSRFAFDCENCYILFQPEISFAIHDLPPDTAETNWTHPVTVRDKIRVAFRDAGREYEVPMKLQEPMVQDIVKKVYPHDDNIQWWLPQQDAVKT